MAEPAVNVSSEVGIAGVSTPAASEAVGGSLAL